MNTLQLRMNVTTPEDNRHAWAFAVKQRRSLRAGKVYVITSVSRQAKTLGVQAGMALADAKLLLPELRVLIYNRR